MMLVKVWNIFRKIRARAELWWRLFRLDHEVNEALAELAGLATCLAWQCVRAVEKLVDKVLPLLVVHPRPDPGWWVWLVAYVVLNCWISAPRCGDVPA